MGGSASTSIRGATTRGLLSHCLEQMTDGYVEGTLLSLGNPLEPALQTPRPLCSASTDNSSILSKQIRSIARSIMAAAMALVLVAAKT